MLTLRLDQATADRRTRPIEEKLAQGLSKYLGRDIRLMFETAEAGLDSPARQRVLAEQDRIARAASAFESDPAVKGLRERFGADVDCSLGQAGELATEASNHDERWIGKSDAPGAADAGDHAEGAGRIGGTRSHR